jgi:hypothetical protein
MPSSVLAAEFFEKNTWYPTILGFLVVFFAILLFCGSIYVLLGTNLGARLGFRVAFTGLMAFMVILTSLWMITASPLNTLKGRIPSWKVQQIVAAPAKAAATEVRDVEQDGRKVDDVEAAAVKAAVDEHLVEKKEIKAEGPLAADANKFARFKEVTEYKVVNTFEIGGSKPNPLDFEFTHKPLFAVVEFCEVQRAVVPFGIAPEKDPPCKEGSDLSGFMVLERDLGSLRVPPMVAFFGSVLLFGLGLLGLHWRERDEQEAETATAASGLLTPIPVQT